MDIAISVNGIPIRLTSERWKHISLGHPEISDYYYEIFETIENPEIIYEGNFGELIAVKQIQKKSNKFVVVIYKEINGADGFIITSFLSNKKQQFINKRIIWVQKK